MSIVEVGENAKSTGAFTILKDTTSNTDFISFDEPSFSATLNSLSGMYQKAQSVYQIPSKRIFTVISSGVKMQAEKNDKSAWVRRLVDSFKTRINDSKREVEIVDVAKESKLSHWALFPNQEGIQLSSWISVAEIQKEDFFRMEILIILKCSRLTGEPRVHLMMPRIDVETINP